MKKHLIVAALMLGCMTHQMKAQDPDLPQQSPWAQVSQKFGLATATIEYSRPSMKGRNIFGNLVPYGEIWRTGANKATMLKLEGNHLSIQDKEIPAGSYSIFTIPGANEWTIIINKNTELWGAGSLKEEEDAMRFTVKPVPHTMTETFTIEFANINDSSATVELFWENTMVSFVIKNDYLADGIKNIDDAFKAVQNTASLYNEAAAFYLDNHLDAAKALDWAKQSVAQRERYWNTYTLARAYAANNMKTEAIQMAEKSISLAKEAGNPGFIVNVSKSIDEWNKM